MQSPVLLILKKHAVPPLDSNIESEKYLCKIKYSKYVRGSKAYRYSVGKHSVGKENSAQTTHLGLL